MCCLLPQSLIGLTGRPKSAEGDKPRAVIICFHKFQTKDMLVRAARKKRDDFKYDGKYKEVMRQLFTRKLKPSLLYQARLFVRADGAGDGVTAVGQLFCVIPCWYILLPYFN